MTDSPELIPTHQLLDLPTAATLDDNVVLLLPGASLDTPDIEQPVRLREALDASNEIILVIDPSGRVLFANRTAREQLDLADEDPVFSAIESLLSGSRRTDVWEDLETQGQWRGDLATVRADGSTVHLELTLLADRTTSGDVQSLTVVGHDVGERRALEQTLEHRSTHDGLTGLSNRQHLLSKLNTLLPEMAQRGQPGSLLLVDIDEFRTVTNSLGHEAGDRVLVAFAYRLLRTFSTNSILARVGGDEFAIFCPGEDNIDELAELMLRTTTAPFYIDGNEVHLSVVTGIAITTAQNPTPDAESLLREADAASHRGKERGRGSFELFEQQLQTDAEDRLAMVQDLRRALRNNELRALYQPKISLSTGRIVGAEALMRWAAPSGELRTPDAFMDVAEDTGLIVAMGRWILGEACRSAVQFQNVDPTHRFQLSINLSVRQLADPSFVGDVEDAIEDSGVSPSTIELEITESALMEDVEASAALLARLKNLGTQVAVDDFGTGYSSLQYLQRLPVDTLKIDQTFVSGIERTEGDRAIVTAIIQLGSALNLTSVAEGVETPGQLGCLRDLGCEQAQGFHIAKPMTLEALSNLVAAQPKW